MYTSQLIDRFAPQVANEQELSAYLSPLFARNEDDQLQFAELFKVHFGNNEILQLHTENHFGRLFKKYKKWYFVIGFGVVFILAAVMYWYLNLPVQITTQQHFIISTEDQNGDQKAIEGRRPFTDFQVSILELLEVSTHLLHPEDDPDNQIRLAVKYNWGDHTNIDTIPHHVYSTGGQYQLLTYISLYRNGIYQYDDTLMNTVQVCTGNNKLIINTLEDIQDHTKAEGSGGVAIDKKTITASSGKDSFTTKEKIQLVAVVTGAKPDLFEWKSNIFGTAVSRSSQFDTIIKQEGTYFFTCRAFYDSFLSPCSLYNVIGFTVYDPDKPAYTATIVPAAGAQTISLLYRVQSKWYSWLGGISLFFFIAALVVAMRSNNRKAKQQHAAQAVDETYNDLLQSFAGKKHPAELPFRNKNYLPIPETELIEAAVQMRRRVSGGAFFLNIPKTISKAVHQSGFFQPVYSPRLHQNEYLVLVDASHNNNQQVKLFDFLIDLLNNQNVFIEKYYYRYEPMQCFSAAEPNGISLEKLSEKYEQHTLLIFGNAYQLLYSYYPVFNSIYSQLLNRWQRKAIITPVPLPDWTDKETQALLPTMPVLPVDVPGLLQLMPTLFNSNDGVLSALGQYREAFYKTSTIDFEDVVALQKYCNEVAWADIMENGKPVNILFQWVAALAVYPKLRWEVTLAIGKALLDKYGKGEELNFTTLLRVARIQWMKDGRFPDETRLELLKILTPENEILARETVLALLAEIPETELDEKHFAWQEKEIQRITNEFILYAYNPEKYVVYKKSKELYGKLLAEKKIKDVVSRLYLKNGEQEKWTTLISTTNGTDRTLGVPLNDYFNPEVVTPDNITPTERTLIRVGIAVAFLSVLGLIFLFVLDLLHTNRFTNFMWKPPISKDVRFEVKADTSIRSGLVNIDVGGSYYTVSPNSGITGNVLISDSLKKIDVTFDGQNILDTNLNLTSDSYNINLRRTSQQPASKITATIFLDKCITDSALYSQIIHQVDKTITVRTSLDMVNRIVNSTCSYTISYTQAVSEKKIDSLIAAFRQRGIPLQKGLQWVPGAIPEQIRIYATPPTNKPVATKPIVYIQYNQESNEATASRNQLMQCLNGIFTFLNSQYKPSLLGFYRNEIRYYRRSFLDSIKPLLACLKKIYPDREFAVTQISGGQSAMDASAKIWIYDEVERTKASIAYGDQVSVTSTGYVNIGPFVKNSRGELFFICVGSNLPALNTSVTRPSRVPNLPPIGVLYAKSNTHTRIGLIKVDELNVNVDYGHGTIRSSKVAAIGDKVMLYDPLTGTSISGAGSTGEVVATNVSTTLIAGKQPIKISGAFTTTMLSSSASDGNLLVDENNFALGILIGTDDKSIVFVPIDKILKEFNVTLVTKNLSPAQAN